MINNNFSKKGSILVPPIAFILFIVLIIASLFTFATSFAEVNVRVADAGFLDNTYAKEDLMNFYVRYSGEKAVESLDKNKDLDIIRINFNNEFKKIINEYKFEDDSLVTFQNKIKEGEFITYVENDKIVFKMQVEFQEEDDDLKFIYKRVIEKEFDLK